MTMLIRTSFAERLANKLTILSFFALSFVVHRALAPRTECLNSPLIAFAQVDGRRINNCALESRLSFRNWLNPLSKEQRQIIRSLEVLDPLSKFLRGKRLSIAVDVQNEDPLNFELGRGFVRLGAGWLKDQTQTMRALTMGVLKTEFPETYSNQFQLEIIADFLLLAVFENDKWTGDSKTYSLMRDAKFATIAPSFEQYCQSPFRSLAHLQMCEVANLGNDEALLETNVWGFRPLLAVSLKRVYDKLSIGEKLHMLDVIKAGTKLPQIQNPQNINIEGLVTWFEVTLSQHLQALLPKANGEVAMAVKRTLKELEVESPTHWELTIDVTNTPAWREILEQMKKRANILKKERVLVFTPEDAKALPSGLPVAWAADEISSQKHVLIACAWPRPEDTVHIQARHLFAHQSCDRLERPFWD
ncbi:MAG: hypothetical protein AB7H97_21715 [Pseudobdellovibrionaceae bacterium]